MGFLKTFDCVEGDSVWMLVSAILRMVSWLTKMLLMSLFPRLHFHDQDIKFAPMEMRVHEWLLKQHDTCLLDKLCRSKLGTSPEYTSANCREVNSAIEWLKTRAALKLFSGALHRKTGAAILVNYQAVFAAACAILTKSILFSVNSELDMRIPNPSVLLTVSFWPFWLVSLSQIEASVNFIISGNIYSRFNNNFCL